MLWLCRGGGRRMPEVAYTKVFSIFLQTTCSQICRNTFLRQKYNYLNILWVYFARNFSLIVVFWGARVGFSDLTAAPRRKQTKKQSSCSKKMVCDAFALPPWRPQREEKLSSRSKKGLVCDGFAVSRWQGENFQTRKLRSTEIRAHKIMSQHFFEVLFYSCDGCKIILGIFEVSKKITERQNKKKNWIRFSGILSINGSHRARSASMTIQIRCEWFRKKCCDIFWWSIAR